MHFRQFYVGCLAHASYLVGDQGEAAVIDPSRDIEMYLDEAERHGLVIRWVLESHLHADFVSGHRDLAARTGATIGIGARADAEFPNRALHDGDEITVGEVRIRALETPGHTPESLSFLVFEHRGDAAPWAVLTGDTLFVGDVGRVDILSSRLPVGDLAGLLYDSLHQKLLTLPDATLVYPAHGAGSLCGRSIGKENFSTIGREREANPALVDHGRDAFIAEITRDVPETPIYFLHSRDLNRSGPPIAEARPLPPVRSAREVVAALERGAELIDARSSDAFAAGHPQGALQVGLDGQYASWVGTLLTPQTPLYLLVDPERAEEAVMRLARVGYDRVEGLLGGTPAEWQAQGLAVATVESVPAESLATSGGKVLDVRRRQEYDNFHLPGATHVPLAQLGERVRELDPGAAWKVVCASGYRSTIAASILQREGFTRVTNVTGGMDAYRRAGLPLAAGSAGGRA